MLASERGSPWRSVRGAKEALRKENRVLREEREILKKVSRPSSRKRTGRGECFSAHRGTEGHSLCPEAMPRARRFEERLLRLEETPAIGALPFRCGARGEDSDDPSQQQGDVRLTEGARRACGHWHPLLQEASGQAHALAEAARLSTRPEHEDYLPRRCATGRSGSARQELRSGRAGQALGGPDIPYVRSREGFLYLAFILYVCSRKVVGWSMATHLRTELVADALGMAIVRRKPSLGLVHHSDRGVQGGFNRWSQHRGLSAM